MKKTELPQDILDFCKSYKLRPSAVIVDKKDGMLYYKSDMIFELEPFEALPDAFLKFKEIKKLRFFACQKLKDLRNLRNLRDIGNLEFVFCDSLVDLEGLGNLEYVENSISMIGGNTISFDGLNKKVKISGGSVGIKITPQERTKEFLDWQKGIV